MSGKKYKFQIGDIFSKYYPYANYKKYLLVIDLPEQYSERVTIYRVIDLEEGEITSFGINNNLDEELYPVKLEA